jgi:hypothetical protein
MGIRFTGLEAFVTSLIMTSGQFHMSPDLRGKSQSQVKSKWQEIFTVPLFLDTFSI